MITFTMLLVLSSLLAIETFPISEAMGEATADSVKDLSRVVQTKSSTFNYFYNYVPTAGVYSTHQKTYELAQEGGSNIEWKTDTLDGLYSFDSEELEQCINSGRSPLICALTTDNLYSGNIPDKEAQEFENYIFQKYFSADNNPTILNCDFPETEDGDFGYKNAAVPGKDINGSISTQTPLKATCSFEDGTVKYQGESESFKAYFTAHDNRYFRMVDETQDFFKTLKEEWSSIGSYHGESSWTECGEDVENRHWRTASNNAIGSAENAIRNRYSSAKSSHFSSGLLDGVPGMELIEDEIKELSVSLRGGASTNIFEDDRTNYRVHTQECSCPGDSCPIKEKAHVRVFPGKSNVKYALKDTNYKIPTEEGWENLVFRVDPYEHDYQSD